MADLRAVRAAVDALPHRPCVLLKDFVLDAYQLVEGRMAGADTALLIVAILPPPQLLHLMRVSRELGMEPLVEVANAREMAIALQAGARLVGVNNRDLHTFHVNAQTTNALAHMIQRGEQDSPEDFKVFLCALSGIKTRADVEGYAAAGCEAVLVGEALMRSSSPALTIRELLGHPRSPSLSAASPPSPTPFPSAPSSPGGGSAAASSASSLLPPSAHPGARHRSGSLSGLSSLRPVLITPPASPSPLTASHLPSASSASPPLPSSLSPSLSSSHPPLQSAAPLPPSNASFMPLSSMSAHSGGRGSPQPTVTLPPPSAPAASAPPLVKVCGLVSAQSALLAYEAGADLLGLIFVPTSKRCVEPRAARAIVDAVRAEAASRLRAGEGGAGEDGTAAAPPSSADGDAERSQPNGAANSHKAASLHSQAEALRQLAHHVSPHRATLR